MTFGEPNIRVNMLVLLVYGNCTVLYSIVSINRRQREAELDAEARVGARLLQRQQRR